jgi:hypothetical protein
MAVGQGRVRRALVHVINDDNLDLYLLGTVALVFTVLGITGISDTKTTSAVVVALLALLAFSQIRSRRLIEQMRDERLGGATALFERGFPEEVLSRRAQAHDLLLSGMYLARTVHGMRYDIPRILAAGGRVRVLVLDPTDDQLVDVAPRLMPNSLGPDELRGRLMTTLDELTAIRGRVGGLLELRVSSVVPAAGFNCVDAKQPHGLVCVQYLGYQPSSDSAPVFMLKPRDGEWYQHFADEAERLWDAGTEWPLSVDAAVRRARRPAFDDEFGPELDAAVESTANLFATGVAHNVFVNAAYRKLDKKLRAGDRVRFVLVDPDSMAVELAAARYHAVRTPERVRERILHTLQVLAELRKTTAGDLSVRLTSHPVSTSTFITDIALFAHYQTYKDPGMPRFVLQPGDAGYDAFLGEAEALWDNAKPYEL